MKGYKIVGRLGWSVIQDTPGLKVKYKVGEYVSRPKKGGPLAVFKDKADAVAFDDYFHELYECVYTPWKGKREELWDEEGSMEIGWLPEGTALASRVKLGKKVKP